MVPMIDQQPSWSMEPSQPENPSVSMFPWVHWDPDFHCRQRTRMQYVQEPRGRANAGNDLSSPPGTWGTCRLGFEAYRDQGMLMAREQLNEEPWQDR